MMLYIKLLLSKQQKLAFAYIIALFLAIFLFWRPGSLIVLIHFFFQEFRTVLASKSELRLRLEAALRSQQEKQKKKEMTSSVTQITHNPTIKLKTDFSNFV